MTYLYHSFSDIEVMSDMYEEKRDCSVKAVALACNVPYVTAHSTLRAKGRKDNRGVKDELILDAVKILGYKVKDVSDKVSARTVMKLEEEPSLREGNYIIFVRGHVLCIREGKVLDWTEGRRHRIKKVYRIYR